MKYMRYDEKDLEGNVVDTKFSFFCKVARSRGGYKITLPRSILKEDIIKCNDSWNVRICSVDSERDSKDYSFNSGHYQKDISFTSVIRMPSTVAPYITIPRDSCYGICSYIPSGNHRPWCQVVMSKRDEVPLIVPTVNEPTNVLMYKSDESGNLRWLPYLVKESAKSVPSYISFNVVPTVINNRIFFKLPSEYINVSYPIQTFGTMCWEFNIYDQSGKLVYEGHTYPARIGKNCYAFFKDREDEVVQKKSLDYTWKITFRNIGYF